MSLDNNAAKKFEDLSTEIASTKSDIASLTTTVSGKQADLTTITGYDATKTQVLQNIEGTLTWVDAD